MAGDNTDSSLQKKRRDLVTLINHIRSLDIDEDSEAANIVLSRLLAEVRRGEVEQIRNHILSCPGISSKSPALATALPALQEALEHINKNSDKSQSALMSSAALLNSFDGSKDGDGSIPRNVPHDAAADTSYDYDSSSISDLDVPVDQDETMQQKQKIVTKKGNTKRKNKSGSTSTIGRIIGTLLRCIFLDLPLATTCLFLVASYSAQHVFNRYYVPILESLTWDDERRDLEYTNYMRQCDGSDVSTLNSDDFIVDPNSTTPEEAVEMTNRHGMTIFPNILTSETSAAMREYVLRKNHALMEDEAIWLISNKNRWSFAIGADDDPSVPPVLQEIATSESFQKSIELLMGEDPAMVEFTAITSAYGAGDQHWHADNDYTGSSMHYARSFVPMYSLFVPLQDTTAAMGATSACPGTHLCAVEDGLSEVCDGLNFQVADSRGRLAEKEEDHIWKTGDGFLMNLNSFHRGPGHTDPNGTERVMLIITISPRPQGPNFDRRQISLGTSYSCRWDMWGMTMKDLAIVDQIKGFPWKQLRTLGIYKPMGSHRNRDVLWGWDYLTVVCSRIVNEQFGFRYDDLETHNRRMKKKGKLAYYLFGFMPEPDEEEEEMEGVDAWPEYFKGTAERCIETGQVVFGAFSVLYLIISLFQRNKLASVFRGVKISSTIGLIGALYLYSMSRTLWAKDITSGVAKRSPFIAPSDAAHVPRDVTLPVKTDILYSATIHAPYLAGHNLIYNYQPGNYVYNELLSEYSVPRHTPGFIVKDFISTIRKGLEEKRARFLQQNVYGDWEIMEEKDIISRIQKQMVVGSNSIMKSLDQEIGYLMSECRHGRRRETVLSRKHGQATLKKLEDSLFGIKLPKDAPKSEPNLIQRLFVPSVNTLRETKSVEKISADSFKEGDIIEGFFQNDGWFKGKVGSTTRRKGMAIHFDDGDYQILSRKHVRRFEHLKVGEEVMFSNDQTTVEVIIKYIFADGRITVLTEDGEEHEVDIREVRRMS